MRRLLFRKSPLIFVLSVMVFLFNVNVSSAEMIKLKTGTTVNGDIVEQSEGYIKLDIGQNTIVTYYEDEIESQKSDDELEPKSEILNQIFNIRQTTPEELQKQKDKMRDEIDRLKKEKKGKGRPRIIMSKPNRRQNYIKFNASEDISNKKFVPPDDKVLLVIGQDKQSINNYLNNINIVPGGFAVYTSIQDINGIYELFNNGGGEQHAQYIIDRNPNTVIQVGLYMVDALDAVINGLYDRNIEKLANWFKKNDRPFYLRIGYEFDSPSNNYQPDKYVAAYQHIVLKLHELGVTNTAYVWHSYAGMTNRSVMDWYPGDDYVDWIAISYFNPYNTDGMNIIAGIAKAKNKPFMIAEATPVKISTDKGEYTWTRWFEFVFDYIDEHDVKLFSYINCDWDSLPSFMADQWGDARLENNEFIRREWIKKIKSKKFLNSSSDLFDKLRFRK